MFILEESKFFSNLPEFCYVKDYANDCTVKVIRGKDEWVKIEADSTVDELNTAIGVTKSQANAMEYGSIFGWDIADPDKY